MMNDTTRSCAISSSATLEVTETQWQTADVLARNRTAAHDGSRRPEADLGDPAKQAFIEFYSTLGEILITEAIERDCLLRNQPFNVKFKLWLSKGDPSPDLITSKLKMDIKTVLPGCRFLNINRARHEGTCRADYYLVVVFDSPRKARLLHPISCDAVSKWSIRHEHSSFFGIDLKAAGLRYYEGPLWRLVNPNPTKKPILPVSMHSPASLPVSVALA